jgi:predicted dehydrogenase
MSEAEIRVGMLSFAHVHAEFRAKALSEIPGARVVVVADDNQARGCDAADRHAGGEFTPDWRELVARGDLDLIMVHSENARHAEQVVAIAEAGIDVFCEKPIATRLEDGARMLEAVERAGVDATVAFVSRFSQEAERAKRIVDTGALGEIVNARSLIGLAGVAEIGCPPEMVAWFEDEHASGGGAWIDEGAHGIDLLRWLVGDIDRIAMLTARRAKPHLQSEDIAVASIGFVNGALGEVTTSWSLNIDVGMRNTLELYGTGGTLVLEPTARHPQVSLYTTRLPAELRGWVIPQITPDETEPHDYTSWPPHVHHYKREVAAYIQRRRNGTRPYGPSMRDGYACLEVLAAGYESARSGRIQRLDGANAPID